MIPGIEKAKRIKIRPGMYLKDYEFHGMRGATIASEAFWQVIKKRVGQIVKAEMKLDDKWWYRLWLTDENGVTVQLYGCSAGYHGQGSRATAQILKECGFNPKRVDEVVFNQETFTLKRKPR